MAFSDRIIQLARQYLPSPFTIALFLTAITYLLALFLTHSITAPKEPVWAYAIEVAGFWQKGFWELLAFAMQMMLILVLGHTLALSKPVSRVINLFVKQCNDTSSAAFWVAVITIPVALFNWGLGLIFGAVFARKVGEHALRNNIPINYPLVAAAGYVGLMVWHGGLSGSAPITINEVGHFMEAKIGVVSLVETIGSGMNITTSVLLIVLIPLVLYVVGKKVDAQQISIPLLANRSEEVNDDLQGAEKLDASPVLGMAFGIIILLLTAYDLFIVPETLTGKTFFGYFNPNTINFMLLGLGLLLHGSIRSFLRSVQEAIVGATGILIQFPLYAGIMGIMKYSGLVVVFSDFFISIANEHTLPLFTFISAGLVNIFVPSGGGQWAVQGPIISEAAEQLGSPLAKNVMALAYGDQLTNMLQPFWALPLLGITGLKARDILPFTFLLFLVGFVLFSVVLMLF